MSYRPPKDDTERLLNLIEALSEPGDDDDVFQEMMRADLEKRGLTLESWAAQLEARGQAVIEDAERARRARRIWKAKIGAAVAVGLGAAAAGGALASHELRGLKAPADVQQTLDRSRR
jgi:hypothetical protein